LIAAPQSLEATAEHARRRARLHAAEDLADVVERLAPCNGGRNDDDTPLREEAA
jgi:hypothetical protein